MKTLIGLFILAIVVVSEAASCTPTSNQATKLQYILTDPTATLTLDDLGFTGNPLGAEFDPDKPKITFTKRATTVQLSGVSCAAGKGTYSMDSSNLVVWNSEDQWLGGAESGTPGYSWEGRDAGSPGFESICVFNFDPPISELWFRYNTGQDVTTVANIYDKDDQLITCTVMESYPNGTPTCTAKLDGARQADRSKLYNSLVAITQLIIFRSAMGVLLDSIGAV
jgi:hypothetical protein